MKMSGRIESGLWSCDVSRPAQRWCLTSPGEGCWDHRVEGFAKPANKWRGAGSRKACSTTGSGSSRMKSESVFSEETNGGRRKQGSQSRWMFSIATRIGLQRKKFQSGNKPKVRFEFYLIVSAHVCPESFCFRLLLSGKSHFIHLSSLPRNPVRFLRRVIYDLLGQVIKSSSEAKVPNGLYHTYPS